MKFLHTSDWHIGRQFHNVSLLEDQAHVLKQIVAYIESEAVDALVIAGDLYDRSVPPAAAVALLDEVFETISVTLGVPIVLIPGNHDSAERVSFAAAQLRKAGIHIFGSLDEITTPAVITGRSGISVQFYGIPYCDPEQVRHHFEDDQIRSHNDAHNHLLQLMTQKLDTTAHNVLISHCFVDGAEACESERPLSLGGADRVDYQPMQVFDYVALGHLHSPQKRGAEHIRYCGSPMKYSFSEVNQKKGVTLVSVCDEGDVEHRHLPLTPLRDFRVIEGEMTDILAAAADDSAADDYLLIRLLDTHAIFDAMGKLRDVYPNVLHLEKPGVMQQRQTQGLKREQLKRGEMEMFADFFSQVTGNDMSSEQTAALEAVISDLHRQEGNT